MTTDSRRRVVPWHLALLLALYVIARRGLAHHLDSPVFGWRPTDLGAIALNYYRNGFHLFYPQIRWGGAGPGYVETEFPLLPFSTAVLFKVLGPYEWVQVIVPLLVGFGLVWVTYRFGSYLFDAETGLAAGVVVATVPVLIMQTTSGMWPDPPTVLFGTLGLYLLARWREDGTTSRLLLGSASIALAILTKIPALYLGIPIAYVFWSKFGARCWRTWEFWASAVIMLGPAVLWYWHAHEVYLESQNTFGILGAGYSKFGTKAILTDPHFYFRVALKVALYHLTPLGAIAFAYGLYTTIRARNGLLIAWLLGVGAYILMAARGVLDGHYQYLLPLLPVAAIVTGAGVTQGLRRLEPLLRGRGAHLWPAAVACSALLFLANAAYAERRFETRDRVIDSELWLKKKITGERVKVRTPPGSLLLVVDTAMDRETPKTSMTPPDVFYFGDRRGWYLSAAWLTPEKIENIRREGALYFVVSGQSVSDFKEDRADIFDYLSARYQKIMDDEDGIIFDLGARK